jgi:hypothetical protein
MVSGKNCGSIAAMNPGREWVERRPPAVLAADVRCYSRLMGADEEGTHAALIALRREVTDPRIAEHRGRIVKTTGEGFLVDGALDDIGGNGLGLTARCKKCRATPRQSASRSCCAYLGRVDEARY